MLYAFLYISATKYADSIVKTHMCGNLKTIYCIKREFIPMMFAVSLVGTTITFIKRKFMTQLRDS